MDHAYNPEAWKEFYIMLGGSIAALTGLLFVATSLHVDEIGKRPHFTVRAFGNTIYRSPSVASGGSSRNSDRSAWGRDVFMRTNRTLFEWDKWCRAKARIAEELEEYYRASMTGDLPPQLQALSKKLDEELLKSKTDSAGA
jgi:hypothetical protein